MKDKKTSLCKRCRQAPVTLRERKKTAYCSECLAYWKVQENRVADAYNRYIAKVKSGEYRSKGITWSQSANGGRGDAVYHRGWGDNAAVYGQEESD